MSLVLSLFPGADLLGMAFEQEGFTVVQGPDVIFGRDIRAFHPPAGKFDGVIGGPPCQLFSGLANLMTRAKHPPENLIPEFERCVAEAQPSWFLMENVVPAPLPAIAGYLVKDCLLNNRWLGEDQNRARRFSFGTRDGRPLLPQLAALESIDWEHAVTSAHAGERKRAKGMIARYTPSRAAELQGLPADFLEDAPLTMQGRLKVIAQGVPIPMGRAIAKAVRKALA